jgi:ribosomal protein S27AE
MGAEEKNRNEILSRIVADLFEKSKGAEELSSKIHRLRDEIKKVIEGEDTIFGKIRGLVESFREMIPEEKQRYNAAIKALSTTSKLGRQEIVKAVNAQHEELKILEKVLLGTAPGWRDELKVMEAKSREMRDEISKLREILGRLEIEEKEILNGMTAREQEMTLVEKAVGELFTDIGAEITTIKKKVEEFTAESAASQPSPSGDSIKSEIPSLDKEGGVQKSEISAPPAPQAAQDTNQQKKCPMCGGQMNDYGEKWQCYSCAYEELKMEKGGGEQKSEIRESSAPQEPQDTNQQKKCPMCGGQMSDYGVKWQCYSCAYEESKGGNVPDKSEEQSEQRNAPEPAPASDSIFDLDIPTLSSREYREPKEPIQGSIQEPIKGSIRGPLPHKKPSPKKKTCPACGKKMNWYPEEKAWRCSFCEYERRI